METLQLNMEALHKLMMSDDVQHWENLPISRLRLASQAKNPYLLEQDIIMVILMDNGRMVGYMGAVPDETVVEGTNIHMAWLSTFWIKEDFRGKGLGKILVTLLNDAWGNKLVATEFTSAAAIVYDRLGFFENAKLKLGYRYFYKADFFSISKERNLFRPLALIFKAGDVIINIFQTVRLNVAGRRNKEEQYKEVALQNLTIHNLSKSAFRQSIEKRNWIFNYPWLTEDTSVGCNRYFFSTRVDKFHFKAIQFTCAGNELLGTIVYRNINNNCNILLTDVLCGANKKFILAKLIDNYFFSNAIASVLSYDNVFNNLMELAGGHWFYKKKRKRIYLFGKELLNDFLDRALIEISEMDGEIVFA